MSARRTGTRMGAMLLALAVPSLASAAGLLDVPFVSQSERLCGGAAAAMVLRYWGARGVRAEDFAGLVDDDAGGIRQSALTGELRTRGLQLIPLETSDTDGLARQIARGRPVVAMIEDRPGRYHYVVIVGSTAERVIYHDPARAPLRTIARTAFDRAWSGTGRWAIVPVPCASCRVSGAERVPSAGSVPGAQALPGAQSPSDSACASLVTEGVRLARAGDRTAAAQTLEAAVALCPASADANLELAGVRFLDQKWNEAGTLAARAVELAPESDHGWRVLASSRFVEADTSGALEAWNRLDEPRLDLVRVAGLENTSHRVVENLVDVEAGTVLTPASLARARRRIAALPSASASRVSYTPAANGLADVDVAIVERPLRPSRLAVLRQAARAAVEREIAASVTGLTPGGERFNAAWRFWDNRPAVTLSAEAPSLFGVTGLWTIEAGWSRQPYALGDSTMVVDERRHAGIRFADWLTGATRVEAGTGVDRWSGRTASAFVDGAVEQRLFDDAVAARVEGSLWPAAAGFGAGRVLIASRTRRTESFLLRARAGFEAATTRAPFDLWPGAGAGHARSPRLRAHPLLEDGVITGDVFGQRLAHASVEVSRTLLSRMLMRLDGVMFMDCARAWRSLSGDERLHVDAGFGVRLRGPADGGAIAVDVARGLRDGRAALTIGWEQSWPSW
jgi:Peptidase_C39 like family